MDIWTKKGFLIGNGMKIGIYPQVDVRLVVVFEKHIFKHKVGRPSAHIDSVRGG